MEVLIVFVTAPSAEIATRIADTLVGESLAACVSVLPGLQSTYRWQGAIERATEQLCVIKTTRDRDDALAAAVTRLHPYEVPEIVAVPVTAGLPAYLAWVADSVGSTRQ